MNDNKQIAGSFWRGGSDPRGRKGEKDDVGFCGGDYARDRSRIPPRSAGDVIPEVGQAGLTCVGVQVRHTVAGACVRANTTRRPQVYRVGPEASSRRDARHRDDLSVADVLIVGNYPLVQYHRRASTLRPPGLLLDP